MPRNRRTHGEGSVFQHTNQKDGSVRWRGYVTRPDGRRKYVSGLTKQCSEAQKTEFFWPVSTPLRSRRRSTQ
jgi:hypothetical protein